MYIHTASMHSEFIPTDANLISETDTEAMPIAEPTPLSSRSNSSTTTRQFQHLSPFSCSPKQTDSLTAQSCDMLHRMTVTVRPPPPRGIGPTGSQPTGCAFHFAYRGLCASVTSQTQRRRTDRAGHDRRRCANNRPPPLELSLMDSFSNAAAQCRIAESHPGPSAIPFVL
ncbi:uncharacterized protein LY79DRAFT_258306 [Colletotrichum navitas]|uniref:Uncharacterized protein n=1 Tax=Colletotrichum navitas TaxID=681940 RepID=A0AAD8PWD1_9PEZI|nr:uncharacterized protein LY79DRAFT_258306 [Colletotrichum navitas]KAK1585881.1 hypothetical protein LY79DRAFT_258306 [Colletotrichum navitas]